MLKSQFLNEVNSTYHGVMLVGATNFVDQIDEAFLRRMEGRHLLLLPGHQEKLKLLDYSLRGTYFKQFNPCTWLQTIFSEFDTDLTKNEKEAIVRALSFGFSGANFFTFSKHLHKLKRPNIISAKYFKPVQIKGQIKYKIVSETTPGAQRLELGKDLVHCNIAPQKVTKREIKQAISKVHVRPNSKIDQALLISCMSELGS